MQDILQRPKSLLTVAQISERIQLGRSWIYGAIRRGEFPAPAVKISTRCSRWDSDAVDKWIKERIIQGAQSDQPQD